jgi:hypothetical protein
MMMIAMYSVNFLEMSPIELCLWSPSKCNAVWLHFLFDFWNSKTPRELNQQTNDPFQIQEIEKKTRDRALTQKNCLHIHTMWLLCVTTQIPSSVSSSSSSSIFSIWTTTLFDFGYNLLPDSKFVVIWSVTLVDSPFKKRWRMLLARRSLCVCLCSV